MSPSEPEPQWKTDLRDRLKKGITEGKIVPMTEAMIEAYLKSTEEWLAMDEAQRRRMVRDSEAEFNHDDSGDNGGSEGPCVAVENHRHRLKMWNLGHPYPEEES